VLSHRSLCLNGNLHLIAAVSSLQAPERRDAFDCAACRAEVSEILAVESALG